VIWVPVLFPIPMMNQPSIMVASLCRLLRHTSTSSSPSSTLAKAMKSAIRWSYSSSNVW
jgi:hypothetical protein